MAESRTSGSLGGLEALIERAGNRKRGPAPVEKWDPGHVGEIDMEIAADGTWYHEGGPINRKALVELFATVLRKDADGETYLVTPVERLRITVADAPFVAVEMHATGSGADQVLTFRTNTGDVVEAGSDHPLRFVTDRANGGLKPYLLVRGRLEALLTRPVTYELMALAEAIDQASGTVFAIRSNGALFEVMEADALAQQAGDRDGNDSMEAAR